MRTAWQNKSASDYVHILASKYGQPSAVDPTPNGMAIWKSDKLMNTCLDRIEVRDEIIPHSIPNNHFDYVYAWINYSVSPQKYMDVMNLSETIGYDASKKQVWARCNTIEAAIATLALVTQIGEDHINLNYAKTNDLYSHYLIATEDSEQFSRLYDLLCYNLRHQSL